MLISKSCAKLAEAGQESWLQPLLAAALGRVGSAPHLGNTVELVLVGVGEMMSQSQGHEPGGLAPTLIYHEVAWTGRDDLPPPHPSSGRRAGLEVMGL